MTSSYLHFLQEQADLAARGLDWNKRIHQRIKALEPFEGQVMLVYMVSEDDRTYFLKVRKKDLLIIHEESF